MRFLSELKRRHVVKVFLVYAVVVLGVVEGADVFFPRLGLPDWSVTLVVALVILGLPVALVLAWAYEITPEGVRRDQGPAAWSPDPSVAGEAEGEKDTAPAAAPAASPAAPDKSIAVLPFADMSPDRDQEYFGDGVAEEIIDALTKLEDLRVAARTSSFAYRNSGADVREIGAKLGVGAILEGSVRKSGGRLRITAQLVSVADGYHLWSERYERESEDVFRIQDEIARAVVDKLRVRLLGDDESLIRATTRNPEAYDVYLKGRWAWRRRFEFGLQGALQYFLQAVDLDPEFALPYAGVADTHSIMGLYGFGDDEEVRAEATEAVERALALGPELPDVRFAAGLYEDVYGWSLPKAEEHFRSAIELGGRHPRSRVWLSVVLGSRGRFEEALAESRGAYEEAPDSTYIASIHGLTCIGAESFDEARETMTRVQRLEPTDLISRYGLGLLESFRDNHEEALGHLRFVYERGGGVRLFAAFLAGGLLRAGRIAQAEEILDGVSSGAAMARLWAYGWGGRLDEAFAELETAVEERVPGTLTGLFLPFCHEMRSDPRWRRLDPFLHGA